MVTLSDILYQVRVVADFLSGGKMKKYPRFFNFVVSMLCFSIKVAGVLGLTALPSSVVM